MVTPTPPTAWPTTTRARLPWSGIPKRHAVLAAGAAGLLVLLATGLHLAGLLPGSGDAAATRTDAPLTDEQAARFAAEVLQQSAAVPDDDFESHLTLSTTETGRAQAIESVGTWRARVLVGLGAGTTDSTLLALRPLGYLAQSTDAGGGDDDEGDEDPVVRVDTLLWLQVLAAHEGQIHEAHVRVQVGVRQSPSGPLVDSMSEMVGAPAPNAVMTALFVPWED